MLDEELEYQRYQRSYDGILQNAFSFGRNYRAYDDVSKEDFDEFVASSVAGLVDITNLSADEAESLIENKIDEGFELESAVVFA